MDYRFVKIKRGSEGNGTWYFNPRTEEQVIEHFKTVVGSEIRDGVDDYIKGCVTVKDKSKQDGKWIYHAHQTTPWARAVEPYWHLNGGMWIESSIKLENELYQQRVNSFRSGKDMYLDNGVVETRLVDGDEIVEEKFEKKLVYPEETHVRIEDVRYMQWNMPDLNIKGTHWYAKIGKKDIVDKDGNMKWDTKEEAEIAAKWFIENKISYKRYNE
jgi:hypothetical protein